MFFNGGMARKWRGINRSKLRDKSAQWCSYSKGKGISGAVKLMKNIAAVNVTECEETCKNRTPGYVQNLGHLEINTSSCHWIYNYFFIHRAKCIFLLQVKMRPISIGKNRDSWNNDQKNPHFNQKVLILIRRILNAAQNIISSLC